MSSPSSSRLHGGRPLGRFSARLTGAIALAVITLLLAFSPAGTSGAQAAGPFELVVSTSPNRAGPVPWTGRRWTATSSCS